jgi:hypothetical protein
MAGADPLRPRPQAVTQSTDAIRIHIVLTLCIFDESSVLL